MPRIPFMQATYRDELPKVEDVEQRLKDFLQTLRDGTARYGAIGEEGNDGGDMEQPLDSPSWTHRKILHPSLTRAERMRIHRRARAYCERAKMATGLAHLSKEAREQIAVLRNGAILVAIPSEYRADEIAAALHDEMPWMGPATERVWHAMRASVRDGDTGLRLPPMLLVGPPGIGKSHWARVLGRHLGVPTTVIDATGEPASFAIVGSQKGWGSASPGRVMETILQSMVVNPLIVIDEIEKAGDARGSRDTSYSLTNALLPLLERSTAAAWSCPYFRVWFDMSWIGWVMTANGRAGLSAPFLSRVPPLNLPDLMREQLLAFAGRQARGRGLPSEAVSAILSALDTASDVRRPSLRTVMRMVDRAAAVVATPVLH